MAKTRYPDDAALHGLFVELMMDKGETGIMPFCNHVGLKMPREPDGWWPAFYGHYQNGKKADAERAYRDLATFPPIASRIVELQMAANG